MSSLYVLDRHEYRYDPDVAVFYPGYDPASDDWIDVLPDLRFPRFARIEVRDDARSPVDLDIALVFDVSAARYMVDTLTVYRRRAGEQVDGTALRGVPIQEFIRQMTWGARIVGTDQTIRIPLRREVVDEVKSRGPSDRESLLWLARVYAVSHAISQPPAKTVQSVFDMPAPTASVWIRRARDRGLLPDTVDSVPIEEDEIEFRAARRRVQEIPRWAASTPM